MKLLIISWKKIKEGGALNLIYIRDLIRKKRNREELTEEESRFFIFSYFKDEILKEQVAALLTLMYTNGVTYKEMADLAQAIAETGSENELYKISRELIDVHPIGGMDDKIVILLNAIMSTLKIPIVKVMNREIGIMDKLHQANFYKVENDFQEIKKQIEANQMVIIEEPHNIAPVENKLYKLRNDIACNDDVFLIAINLMSQKIALGIPNIIFDISYGEKAYVKTYHDAKLLSKILIQMGKELEKNVKCIVTKLDEPVGKYFGNVIEMNEVLEALKGNMSQDVKELILEMGTAIITLIDRSKNEKQCKSKILEVIQNGSAYRQLENVLKVNTPNYQIAKAENIVPVMAIEEGYVQRIDMSATRVIAKYLEAIRYHKEEPLDLGAGIEFNKKIGDKVNKGDILGYIHTNNEVKISQAVKDFKDTFIISKQKVKNISRIEGIIG